MTRIFQFTGLSGAGKSTLSSIIREELQSRGYRVILLDGDEIRKTLSVDLGFSREDRLEQSRRVARLAQQSRADFIFIATINPYEEGRKYLKENCAAHLIWLKCDMNTLKKRDPKGLYKRASLPDGHPQKLANLTGINDPFEPPAAPDLTLDTSQETSDTSARKLLEYILNNPAL